MNQLTKDDTPTLVFGTTADEVLDSETSARDLRPLPSAAALPVIPRRADQVMPAEEPVAVSSSGGPLSIMIEMRPALDGFAGIPQETRLLFRGLSMIEGVRVEGMIQAPVRRLARGAPLNGMKMFDRLIGEARRINRYSRFIVSLADRPYRTMFEKIADFFERRLQATWLGIGTVLFNSRVRLTGFEGKMFEDFVWRTMFAKTLPASDFDLVAGSNHRICAVPWNSMHLVGLHSLNYRTRPKFPKLDTRGVDLFIAQTPYPGRVRAGTKMVVRYHDAIPIFMPHTIPDKSSHQAKHFYALMSNVDYGAWFACVSEATRQDLIRLFPEVAPRAVTIHNMVSHHYYPDKTSPALVPGIIRSRLYESTGNLLRPEFLSLREQESFYSRKLTGKPLRYLVMVSTIEPRKNHARLLAAWEVLKAEVDPDLKLVVVGLLGWDYTGIASSMQSWIERGDLFCLASVPSPDLRVLYQHALATVCPSLGEGFDYSGIEAMRSGGIVLASDIPVHREVYEDAAEYFDPYATSSLVRALRQAIYSDDAAAVRERLLDRGADVSARYLPERILPQWRRFIEQVRNDSTH